MVKPQLQGNQMGAWGVVLTLVDTQQSTTQADRFGGGGAGVESVQTRNIRLPHYVTINHTRQGSHLRTQ